MPIQIFEDPAAANLSLTTQADGFLFWYDFMINGAGNPAINSALLAFTYDASRHQAGDPSKPSGPAPKTYRFDAAADGSLEVGQAVLAPLPSSGSPSRRCVTAVFTLRAGAGPMTGWLQSGAWAAQPPKNGYASQFDASGELGFDYQSAAWGGAPRFASRIESTMIGADVDSLGIIAPLMPGPMIQSFYGLLDGAAKPGAAVGGVAPALEVSISGQEDWKIPAPVGCSGYAMIVHGVLAPDPDEYFNFADWIGLGDIELARRVRAKSYDSIGVGLPPNDQPQEIIYLEGLAGMQRGRIPTY